jgi:hypothetical protein
MELGLELMAAGRADRVAPKGGLLQRVIDKDNCTLLMMSGVHLVRPNPRAVLSPYSDKCDVSLHMMPRNLLGIPASKVCIHVASSKDIFGTIFLVLLLLGVRMGVLVFGVRLSRR